MSDNIFDLNPHGDESTPSNGITAGEYFSKIATAGFFFSNLQGQIQEPLKEKPKSSNEKHCFRVIEDVEVQNVTIPLSYKYEMVVQNGNVTDKDLVGVETNVTNYLVEQFCQSNRTRNVLGLSYLPSDYVYYDKECTIKTNLSSKESCYVVQGILSIALCSNCDGQDVSATNSTYVMDLEIMYLNAIKTGMDEFLSSHVNVTYVEENNMIAKGSSYTNINSNSSYADVVQNDTMNMVNTIQNDIKNPQIEISENISAQNTQSKNIILIGILVVVAIITLMLFLATMRLLFGDFRKWYKRRKARNKKKQNKKEIEKIYRIKHSMSDGTIGIGKNPLLSGSRFGWNMSSIVPVDEEVGLGVGSM